MDCLRLQALTKQKLLTAQIWLTSMEDFAAMNEVWDAWVAPVLHLLEPVSNQSLRCHRSKSRLP